MLNANNVGPQFAANYYSGTLGRLDSDQTAKVLGFKEEDIPILSRHGLLEPLGKPAPNCTKYFAGIDVMQLAADKKWLSKATQSMYQHWQGKNSSRAMGAAMETIGGAK